MSKEQNFISAVVYVQDTGVALQTSCKNFAGKIQK